MSSPTARTLERLRKEGWTCAIVEKVVPHTFIKQDLFGCIDILAMKDSMLLAIQATVTASISARAKKSSSLPALWSWLATHNLFEIWGWSKMGERGKAKRWTLTRQPYGTRSTHIETYNRVPLSRCLVPNIGIAAVREAIMLETD